MRGCLCVGGSGGFGGVGCRFIAGLSWVVVVGSQSLFFVLRPNVVDWVIPTHRFKRPGSRVHFSYVEYCVGSIEKEMHSDRRKSL